MQSRNSEKRIDPLWRTDPAFVRVLAALGAPAVDVRAVGGCVRDAVVDSWTQQYRSEAEIDIGTPEPPPVVTKRLQDAGLRVIPTGLAHGTVTAVVDGRTFEITSLRRDTACDGRHAAVEFTADWEEDSRRRDFTMNAMSMTPDGTLYDYHGGWQDLGDALIRFIGDPADRIKEDYLRILRLFRFSAVIGWLSADREALAACAVHKDGLRGLSGERIQAELAKILGATVPLLALGNMRNASVLTTLLPIRAEQMTDNPLGRFMWGEMAAERTRDRAWLRRLAALIPPESADTVADRLKLSNTDRATLLVLLADAPVITPQSSDLQVDTALFALGASTMRDRVLLTWAEQPVQVASKDDWLALLARIAAWQHRPLPVGGGDVLALGLAPGPRVGELLGGLTEWWIAGGFKASREDALAELRRRAHAAP